MRRAHLLPFPLRVLTDLPARPEGQDRGGGGRGSWHSALPTQGTVCSPPTSPSSLSAPASEAKSVTRATGKVGRVMKVGVWPPREVRRG